MIKFAPALGIMLGSQCIFAVDKEIDWPDGSIPLETLQKNDADVGNIFALKSSVEIDEIALNDIQNSLAILCESGQSFNKQLIHIISDKRYFEDDDLKSILLSNVSEPMDASGIGHRKWQEFAQKGWVATYQPETRWLVFRPWSGHNEQSVQLDKNWCN